MAVVDPYSPCPCGSGQKFKWCCHKVEAVAERAQRLFEGGQHSSAIATLDEGLKKDPQNAWLLTRKALYLVQTQDAQGAKDTLRLVLQKQPRHLGAVFLMTRLIIETEGPVAGVALLQQALSDFKPEERRGLARLVRVVGAMLSEVGLFAAALKHLELDLQLAPEPGLRDANGMRRIETNASVSPWQKNPYQLSEPAESLPADTRDRFSQALEWAGQGLWGASASAFELLSTDSLAGPEADRNLGLCRLWLADNSAAVPALRRYMARAGTTPDAVDLEVLCQQIEPSSADDQVEEVQWIWPLRDREGLLKILRDDPAVHEGGPASLDADDPDSPEVEQFGLLDRPQVAAAAGLKPSEIALNVGRVLVGTDIVALESFDDGRLDALSERFTAMAGSTIARAHPKSKPLGKVSRSSLELAWEWVLPEGMDPVEVDRLNRDQGVRMISEVWPNTPMPYLGGRTPVVAGAAGDAEVPLRAALMQFEQTHEAWRDAIDFSALRERLKIGPEPEPDPETVSLHLLHIARLRFVPVGRLRDDQLLVYYVQAKRMMQVDALERAAEEWVARPDAMERAGIAPVVIFSDLAVLKSGRGKFAEAFDWIKRGRQADPASARARNAPVWDMLELRLKAQSEDPASWVPDLAVIMDRYGNDEAANQVVLMTLVELGLLRVVPGTKGSEDAMIDPRPLQGLMAEYGPRVTTASGQLGVAATRGEIWTPGSATGSGGIWTPGSGSGASAPGTRTSAPPPAGDKPKLIIPGR